MYAYHLSEANFGLSLVKFLSTGGGSTTSTQWQTSAVYQTNVPLEGDQTTYFTVQFAKNNVITKQGAHTCLIQVAECALRG